MQWLHRIVSPWLPVVNPKENLETPQIIGPKESTEPQAGLDSTTRAGPLARLIVDYIVSGGDPEKLLFYNSINWTNASHHHFPAASEWLKPIDLTVNGHNDSFSQRKVLKPFLKSIS